MKIKVIIVILAVACAGLAIGLFAVKKSGEEQHVTDANSIADLSKQVVDANGKIDSLNQVNLTYSNDMVLNQDQAAQLSNSLAAAVATIASSQATIAIDQDQITNLNTRIGDLENENKVLDERANELTNTIAQLNGQIEATRSKLASSEHNSTYLQQELQKQMVQKAEMEHKFNDLDELRQQVKVIKTDLYVTRRIQLMKNDSSQKKGAQLLMSRALPATNNPAAGTNYGLNVEIGSDGSVRVIQPMSDTNAPAH